MMNPKGKLQEIISDLSEIIGQIDENASTRMAERLLKANKIFVAGAGSSRFIGNIFASRLVHLGMNVFFTDETISPSIRPGDVLVLLSGSGETLVTTKLAEAAKKLGCGVIAVTSYPSSNLGKMADLVVEVKGREKVPKDKDFLSRQLLGEYEPLTHSGIIFEIAALIFLEEVISDLVEKKR
jgi:6-phospho 3-hexuloisomerase